MSDWIDHYPLTMPVEPDTIVEAELEDGYVLSPMAAHEIDWNCHGDDVVRYRIVEE